MTQQDTQPPAETLAEAREIAIRFALPGTYDGISTFATQRGDADDKPYMRAILAALTRRAGGDAGAVERAYRQGQIDMRDRAAAVCDERGAEEQESYGLNRAAQNYFRARNAVRDLEPAALALPAPVVEGASLERALLVFAACARDLGPDVPDDEWAKFRLLASDYRRAHAAYVSLTGTEPPFPEDAHAALSEGRTSAD